MSLSLEHFNIILTEKNLYKSLKSKDQKWLSGILKFKNNLYRENAPVESCFS